MKKFYEEIRDIYEVLESMNEKENEKLEICSLSEDIMVGELEKMRFDYFRKGFLACLLYDKEKD